MRSPPVITRQANYIEWAGLPLAQNLLHRGRSRLSCEASVSLLLLTFPFSSMVPPPPTLLSKTEKYEVMEVLFQNYFGLVTYLHVLDPKNTHTAHMNASALPRNVRKQYCSLVCV